ncbi:LruC domain-containing protein [Leptospira sp. 'Mane']|uniref:LruC domain-containing protein n=1 Tax=Leptospira sp. 'Mane' TaxID=3387407 RepID=UPI00398B6ACA
MLKKILIITLMFGLQASCSSKKKGIPLFLLMLGGGGTASVSASTETIASAESGDSFTVVPLSDDSGNGSTGGNSGDGVFTTPSGPTEVLSNIHFQVVNDTFLWDNTISTYITIKVSNEDGVLSGINVKASEDQSSPGIAQFLSQGLTGNDGLVTIRITVHPSVSEVIVTIYGINPKTGKAQEITGRIPIQVPESYVGGGSGSGNGSGDTGNGGGTVVVAPEIDLSTVNFGAVAGCLQNLDADCDGVLDADDEFPTDAELGWTTRTGRHTLAWEDYYQSSHIQNGTANPNNDMDLNDHVTVFSTEIDYAPTGKAKTIRGIFTHVGKGAGFNHDLRLSLDVPTTANFSVSYVGNNGQAISSMNCSLALASASNAGDCVGGNLTSAQLKKGILILPNSQNTLYNSKNAPNVGGALNFVLGMTSNFTITFSDPVDLTAAKNLSGGHLNYFLAVSGTGEKIFRPGFVKSSTDNTGYDLYIDRVTGFPFGVIVPGVFNFPREVTNILDPNDQGKTGYPAFKEWASSKGTKSRNWFEQSMTSAQTAYVVDIKSNYLPKAFTAVLVSSVRVYLWELAISLIVIGASIGSYFRRKMISNSMFS